MKRLFTLLSCIALFACMTVTTFAAGIQIGAKEYSYDIYDNLSGSFKFNSTMMDYAEENGGYFYVYWTSSTPICYYLTSKLEIDDNGRVVYSADTDFFKMFWDATRNGWALTESTFTHGTKGSEFGASASSFKWASHDFKYTDGSTFMSGDSNFREPPLATMVLKLTEEELVEVAIPEMVGTMKVLVPCGVGLMALLVGLSLFGKRSLLFLR